MPKNLNPLLPEQREKWRAAAKEAKPKAKLIGLVMPDTGVRRSAMAHMKPDWLRLEAERPHIMVPSTDECTLGYEKRGVPTSQGVPCNTCRDQRGGRWNVKTLESRRRVWVNEEETREILESWFSVHDTVCSEGSINRIVRQIAERSDLDRHVMPHHLRQTYGTILAEREHTAHEIKKLMGHKTIREAKDYVDMYGPALGDSHVDKWHQNA